MPIDEIATDIDAASAWLIVDFERNTPDPARVFRATAALIEALVSVDQTLIAGLGYRVIAEPVLVDIQSGSLKTRLANVIRGVPDDLLAKGDLKEITKAAVGHFLVRGKQRLLSWLETPNHPNIRLELEQIRVALVGDAKSSGAAPIGYSAPTLPQIADHLREFARATKILRPEDRVTYEPTDGSFSITVLDPATTVDETAFDEALTSETLISSGQMLLMVKRPDFLGKSQWEFRHGSASISAPIDDEVWLSRFRARSVQLAPGDSLVAVVRTVSRYVASGELLRQSHVIEKVIDVRTGLPDAGQSKI